ncbi:M24 family metallopeptidase [Salidesulfovibrio onnuriiensis]|uniref:M24 family metallopeptidase n=1 Tax=Salidesulfovibrio onnuriiensis TaxID=2583823 RepID=UPI0011C70751|nr:M24 family metallopeptidase [Salidesulfovibrio onnuriiensis]
MFESLAQIPVEELQRRHDACRKHLESVAPGAGGLLIFSRLNIYYMTGTMGQGVLWLPMQGKPVLMIRKGIERARLESGLGNIVPFKSYSDMPGIAAEVGCPFPKRIAAIMSGLTWNLGMLLQAKLGDYEFVAGDHALTLTRAVKSEWELRTMRLCGERHHCSLFELIPRRIRPGMTEREISHVCWQVFFENGHQGLLRMQAHGEEAFLGHVSAGDSGNYPSSFNGPLGVRGEHPAIPLMGYAGKAWNAGEPLALDIGFVVDGYQTDKTQVYWAGAESSIPDNVRRAHGFCIEIQNSVAAMAKPGVTPEELYLFSQSEAEKHGFAEGFMGLGDNKVPFLGHGIGLNIDEYPAIARKFTQPLEAGMALALEPKVGIEGVGMVGVENTFEVTDSGAKSITGDDFSIVCVE